MMVFWAQFVVNKLEYLGMILGVRYFLLNFNEFRKTFYNSLEFSTFFLG
jgi:hypothetical protein